MTTVTRNKILAFSLFVLISLVRPPIRAQYRGVETTIWTGQSGGYRWRWTTQDLTATDSRTSRHVFSAAERKTRENKEIIDDPDCRWASFKIQPLAVVGGIAVYQSEDLVDLGGAHPTGGSDIVVVDPARPGHTILLTDLFPDADILRALLADRVVQKGLKVGTPSPHTLPELMQALSGQDIDGDPDFPFEPQMLARFAFHHLENGKVAVRLFVFGHSEAGRNLSTQLGLLLPIPAKLATSLARAANGRAGFLMANSKKLAHGRTTEIYRKEEKRKEEKP